MLNPNPRVVSQASYSSVGQLADSSQDLLYAVNALFLKSELGAVAVEWSRLASDGALLVLVQHFEPEMLNALVHKLLALKVGWVAVAYEERGAAGARTVVLRRGGGDGAVEVPPVKLKPRRESTAECGLNYIITVPPAAPSEKYPDGFSGGAYAGSAIRSRFKPSRSANELFLGSRGREHLKALAAGTHDSRQFQHAINVHRAVPGGDPNWLPFAHDGSDMANVAVTKRDLRQGQFSHELVTETVDFEQVDLDDLGPLYPDGRRLAQSSRASSPDPNICSDAGPLLPSPPPHTCLERLLTTLPLAT